MRDNFDAKASSPLSARVKGRESKLLILPGLSVQFSYTLIKLGRLACRLYGNIRVAVQRSNWIGCKTASLLPYAYMFMWLANLTIEIGDT